MKKIFYIVVITLLTLTSCEINFSTNGKLDALWQITEIQVKDGQPQNVVDEQLTWAFQFNLLELRSNKDYPNAMCRFEHKGDSLRIYQPLRAFFHESDIPFDDANELHPYGLYTLDEHFKVETLNSDRMILSSDSVRVVFRRY